MGAGHADEEVLLPFGPVGIVDHDVEPGEAQSRRDGEHDGADPADPPQLVQDEAVEDQRRGHAEIQEVGQGVEFRAEAGGSLQEAGDPPVDAVEEGGDDHRDDGPLVLPVEGQPDRPEPETEGDQGDDVRGDHPERNRLEEPLARFVRIRGEGREKVTHGNNLGGTSPTGKQSWAVCGLWEKRKLLWTVPSGRPAGKVSFPAGE